MANHRPCAIRRAALAGRGLTRRQQAHPRPPSTRRFSRFQPGELGLKLTCSREERPAGTAGALKAAEALITDSGARAPRAHAHAASIGD